MNQNANYFGLSLKHIDYNNSKFVVVPVPYEGAVNFGKGAGKGPMAILNALSQVELFDLEDKNDSCRFGIHTLRPLVIGNRTTSKIVSRIGSVVSSICGDSKIPITIGGSHTIAIPSALSTLARKKGTIICFDAHADLWNLFKGSKFNHACVNRRLAERHPLNIIGCRNISREEWDYAKQKGIPIYTADRISSNAEKIKESLLRIANPVYLSIDVDVLDPSLMPATGAPEPGGLSWESLIDLIRWICNHKKVIGADIVELAPISGIRHPQVTVATLLYRLIRFISRGL